MLKKPAFLIDSTLVTGVEDMNIPDLFIIPLYAIIEDKPYRDVIELNPTKFYEEMVAGKSTSTSQPPVGDFVEMYEKIRDLGYSDIFVFTLSSGLSGTYSTAVMAKGMVEDIAIHIVDTKIVTAIAGIITKQITEFAKTANSPEEVIAFAEKSFAATKVAAYIANLDPLKKSGRISKVVANVGNLLQIKPLITLEDGTIELLAKERVESQALKRCVESVMENGRQVKNVIILHTIDQDLQMKLEQTFTKLYPDVTYKTYSLSPVIGVHIGNEGAAIFVQYEN